MEKRRIQQTPKAAEQLKKNGGCIAKVDLGVQPSSFYSEEELRVIQERVRQDTRGMQGKAGGADKNDECGNHRDETNITTKG